MLKKFLLILFMLVPAFSGCRSSSSQFEGYWDNGDSILGFDDEWKTFAIFSRDDDTGGFRIFMYPVLKKDIADNVLTIFSYYDIYKFTLKDNKISYEVFSFSQPMLTEQSMEANMEQVRNRDAYTGANGNYARTDEKFPQCDKLWKFYSNWTGTWLLESMTPALKINAEKFSCTVELPELEKIFGKKDIPISQFSGQISPAGLIDGKLNLVDSVNESYIETKSSFASPMIAKFCCGSEEYFMFPEKIKSDYENILRQYMKEADLAKEKDKELVALHEKKRAEEKAEKERQEKEARAKELAEKRAKISEFTFGPVKLSLTPLQMVKDSLPDYDIITTFPVEQSGNQIKTSKEKLNFENIQVFRKVLEPHEDFFRYTKPKTTHDYRWYSNQELVEHHLELPQDVLAELGIEINCVLDIEKNREDKLRTRLIAIYYTLPGQQPKMLYYKVLGDILADAEEVYKERYGEPETQAMAKGVQEMVWRSPSEIAILRAPLREADLQIASLLVLSQTGYDEIFGMLHKKKEAATREAAEKEKQQQEEQKKAREARKSRI